MKTKILTYLLFAFTTSMFVTQPFSSWGQNDPWTQEQLLAPAELAKVLNNPKSPQPIVFGIGMQAIIKGSIDIGPAI